MRFSGGRELLVYLSAGLELTAAIRMIPLVISIGALCLSTHNILRILLFGVPITLIGGLVVWMWLTSGSDSGMKNVSKA